MKRKKWLRYNTVLNLPFITSERPKKFGRDDKVDSFLSFSKQQKYLTVNRSLKVVALAAKVKAREKFPRFSRSKIIIIT